MVNPRGLIRIVGEEEDFIFELWLNGVDILGMSFPHILQGLGNKADFFEFVALVYYQKKRSVFRLW